MAGALGIGFSVDCAGGDLLEGAVATGGGAEPLLEIEGGDGAALVLGMITGRGASLVTVTYTVTGWQPTGALGEAAGAEATGADAAGEET